MSEVPERKGQAERKSLGAPLRVPVEESEVPERKGQAERKSLGAPLRVPVELSLPAGSGSRP